MKRFTILAGALALLASAGSLAAQEADTTAPAVEAPPAVETPAMEAPAAEAPAAEAVAAGAEAGEAPAEHDWEFVLAATDKAPGASATVMVVDAEQGSDFVLVANGLPLVDTFDEENVDVNAYTVWVVPGKEKVAESQLAGILTVSPEGTGRLEAETDLETFGVIVTATPDGAPMQISGVPVLTGIPVQADAPPDAVEAAAETAADVADEMNEPDVADQAEDVVDEMKDEGVADQVEDVVDEMNEPDVADQAEDVAEEVSEGVQEVTDETAEAEAEAAEKAAQEPDTTP